jgi:hypothetical protein
MPARFGKGRRITFEDFVTAKSFNPRGLPGQKQPETTPLPDFP